MVTLNVGVPATAFCIHRDLLCRESPVFKAAFTGHFREARKYVASFIYILFSIVSCDTKDILQLSISCRRKVDSRNTSQTMNLVEDHAVVFEQISTWLYTGKIPTVRIGSATVRIGSLEFKHVYATAEKYCMVNLKNYLVGIFFETAARQRVIPSINLVTYVYSTTPQNSPFRKILVALYTWHMNKASWMSEISLATLREVPDLAADLAFALGNRQFVDSRDNPFRGRGEDFYE